MTWERAKQIAAELGYDPDNERVVARIQYHSSVVAA